MTASVMPRLTPLSLTAAPGDNRVLSVLASCANAYGAISAASLTISGLEADRIATGVEATPHRRWSWNSHGLTDFLLPAGAGVYNWG